MREIVLIITRTCLHASCLKKKTKFMNMMLKMYIQNEMAKMEKHFYV